MKTYTALLDLGFAATTIALFATGLGIPLIAASTFLTLIFSIFTAFGSSPKQGQHIKIKGSDELGAEARDLQRSPNSLKIAYFGGAANAAFEKQGLVAIVIAGNSGRPGGGVTNDDDWSQLDRNKLNPHTTQEEDVFSNFLRATYTRSGNFNLHDAQEHFKELYSQWGLSHRDANSESGNFYSTKQGVDYVNTVDPNDFSKPCVFTSGKIAKVDFHKKHKSQIWFYTNDTKQVDLLFIAGPNASQDGGTSTGSMQRTLCKKAVSDYTFFYKGIQAAIRAALNTCERKGYGAKDTVLLPPLSCGIYAGKHKHQINKEFPTLVQEILDENHYAFEVKICGKLGRKPEGGSAKPGPLPHGRGW
ncbi:hypothetical protein N9C31_00335 [Gammaproteobacteria bacterium]|nr:hypothetical protein [Gammaproteobacteria bacterium]